MKSIAKGLLALNVLSCLITAATAWFLGQSSASQLLDIASYVGLAIGALGALMFVGSGSGISGSTGMAASAADQPSRIMNALWMDRTSGISAGALFVLGGLTWIAFAWLLAAITCHLETA
ncbi:hypothetical protein [Microvirga lotononidis]|uniref:Uncharacterized protein n=1 Tax=Microvirga lotononidis TaxID=864069 RepID=I4Z0Y9_9HYPH|nr:hypothetical protein [Microvirga lotononidis]EIM29881.1 hypothetical protein MicloDRAFT_00012010 [Microvirga lotononidis]WQO31038.1 hypothetical protein U0023_32525 [Microvirga lotononidis]